MKIPVWLATALVTAAFGAAAIPFEMARAELKEVRGDITQLKIDVAVIKARTEPLAARHVAINP